MRSFSDKLSRRGTRPARRSAVRSCAWAEWTWLSSASASASAAVTFASSRVSADDVPRQTVAATEWQGLHPHAFRHLVATRLDGEGLSAREIADYLGHERVSMTQDVYMARRVAGAAASTDSLRA